MIAKLFGRVDSLGSDHAVLDVNGVGYLVFCSSRSLQALSPLLARPGKAEAAGHAVLFVETVVREDHIHLYGFMDEAERAWFNILRSVQGVGTRVALGILSVLSPLALRDAILKQDKRMLTRAPSIGPKLAGRIATELKEKVKSLPVGTDRPSPAVSGAAGANGLQPVATAAASDDHAHSGTDISAMEPPADAISALVNLGYRPFDAEEAVRGALHELDTDGGNPPALGDLIRVGLRNLTQ